jgi:hypothetical protein
MKAFNAENDKEFGIERFSMKFGNGNAISVVFGKGTYSDQGETTAEVAAGIVRVIGCYFKMKNGLH